MIRQAISCDICGRDKQQTNHWFVAYEHGPELRISGWSSQARTSTKAKHLCGQTCLHKLVDDFMARTIALRIDAGGEETPVEETRRTRVGGIDASLTASAAHPLSLRGLAPTGAIADDFESSAHLLHSPGVNAQPRSRIAVDPVPVPDRPVYNSRAWRAEAWRREQEREKQSAQNAKTSRRGSAA